MIDSGIWLLRESEHYEERGIDLIENTPEEIAAVTVEMDERLKGTWQASEEDEALQQRFWSCFKPPELELALASRMGAKFLRDNRALLE
jgi:putative glycosyltransferase (TIGR04372 family)